MRNSNITKLFALIAIMTILFTGVASANTFSNETKIKTNASNWQKQASIENFLSGIEGIDSSSLYWEESTIVLKYNSDVISSDMIVYSMMSDLNEAAEVISDGKIEANNKDNQKEPAKKDKASENKQSSSSPSNFDLKTEFEQKYGM
jgi:hypothetical protein